MVTHSGPAERMPYLLQESHWWKGDPRSKWENYWEIIEIIQFLEVYSWEKSLTIDLDFSTSNGKMVGFLHLQWKHMGKIMGTSHQEKGGFNGNMLEADRTK